MKYSRVDWQDGPKMRAFLEDDGWRTPDTYCNRFKKFENEPAVYLFQFYKPYADGCISFKHSIVAYVGMSVRLKARIASHNILPRLMEVPYTVTLRWFKPTERENLRAVEREYIQRFNPPWNIAGKARGIVLQ